MTPEEFRAAGHRLVDWIADYRETIESRPVGARAEIGEIRDQVAASGLTEGRGDTESMLSLLDTIADRGVVHTQHPMHFAWFPSNVSLSSVLGDMASTGLATLGLSYDSAPALTEIEQFVCEVARRAVGLDDGWSGVIADTASTSCVVALVAARERAARLGIAVTDMRVYYSEHAHSSVGKGARVAGFADATHRVVGVDESFALRVDDLAAMLADDLAAGLTPVAIVPTIGATNTGSIDPLAAVIAAARGVSSAQVPIWVHVDAAMAGGAMVLPERRHLWAGVDGADSLAWNPHKWWGAALDCSLFYVRDVNALTSVYSTSPSYLRGSDDGAVVQYRDWGIPLGRRFRALKLLFLFHFDGLDAIAGRVRRDLDNALWLADQVRGTPNWEVLAPVDLQTVCVRHRPDGLDGDELDDHTLAWVAAATADDMATLTPALVDGRWLVRVSIGAEPTERHHVDAVWQMMRSTAER